MGRHAARTSRSTLTTPDLMPLLLLILFIGFPIVELYVIIQVGQEIGVLATIALLFLSGFIGGPLAASQGRQVWARFNQTLAAGRVPGREVFDGVCVIAAGALMMAPGFVTDIIGISLLLPPLRSLWYRLFTRRIKRVGARPIFVWQTARGAGGAPQSGPGPRPRRSYDVEGTAREVEDPALPRSGEPGRRGVPGDPSGRDPEDPSRNG